MRASPIDAPALAPLPGRAPVVVVPLDGLDHASLRALAYARSLAPHVIVALLAGELEASRLRRRARALGITEYAELISVGSGTDRAERVARFVEELAGEVGTRAVAVVVGRPVPRQRWLAFLHDDLARGLRRRIGRRPNTLVVEVPTQL